MGLSSILVSISNNNLSPSKEASIPLLVWPHTGPVTNNIINENKYTPENTKGRKKLEFCVIQEMLLRHFDKIKKDNKTWFFNQSAAMINNIEKISF